MMKKQAGRTSERPCSRLCREGRSAKATLPAPPCGVSIVDAHIGDRPIGYGSESAQSALPFDGLTTIARLGGRPSVGPGVDRYLRSMGAVAATIGKDVFLQSHVAAEPSSPQNRGVLAHEAIHLIQQQGASGIGRALVQDDERAEAEADEGAAALLQGRSPSVLHRDSSPTLRFKYENKYERTGAIETRMVSPIGADRPVPMVYEIVVVKEAGWLSMITHDYGWHEHLPKEEAYGARRRDIIFPWPDEARPRFNPDRVEPGERFAVRRAPSGRSHTFPPMGIKPGKKGPRPSKKWMWRLCGGLSATFFAGFEVAQIDLWNPETGWITRLEYKAPAVGWGAPLGVDIDDSWRPVGNPPKYELYRAISADDWPGIAFRPSVGLGYSAGAFELYGPKAKLGRPVILKAHGFAGVAGVTASLGSVKKVWSQGDRGGNPGGCN